MQEENYLIHYGILGMKWGIRRYQNLDGTLTDAGKRHIQKQQWKEANKEAKHQRKLNDLRRERERLEAENAVLEAKVKEKLLKDWKNTMTLSIDRYGNIKSGVSDKADWNKNKEKGKEHSEKKFGMNVGSVLTTGLTVGKKTLELGSAAVDLVNKVKIGKQIDAKTETERYKAKQERDKANGKASNSQSSNRNSGSSNSGSSNSGSSNSGSSNSGSRSSSSNSQSLSTSSRLSLNPGSSNPDWFDNVRRRK